MLAFGIIIMVFVMFFLISSNNSFIKARKKEISTYSLFGMTNEKIGKLLFMETMIVGFTALVIGVGVGIFLSKLTAMVLLDISLASFTGDIEFSIAPKAIYMTAIVFMAIFCVMGLSGLRTINKFELVDLFKGDKVSEGNSKGSLMALILSLILIGAGYYLASINDPFIVVSFAIPILVLVISGTYLFFWGGLPKVLNLIKRNRSRYYQGVNLVSTSMFSHRMKSIGSVMATIAVLSAVATTAIATGFTLYSSVEESTYDTIGYDMYFYGGQEELLDDVRNAFQKHNVRIIDEYTTQRYKCSPEIKPIIHNDFEYRFGEEEYFRVYSESEYNKLISISRSKLKPVYIKPGMAMLGYRYPNDGLRLAIDGKPINFSNQTLRFSSILQENFSTFGARYTLVLNDNDFDTLYLDSGDIIETDSGGAPLDKVTVFKFENPLKSRDLNADLMQILDGKTGSYRTAYNHYNESLETFGLVCFIGFFMSVVFILMTASLLYFKQIMAAEEERRQYKMLRKIGMDTRIEKKVITKRLFPVFLIPLLIGIIHSMFAMKAADTMIFSNMIPVDNSYLTVLSFSAVMYAAYALVYGIFYFITKGQYSRIVK
ncbi:MAG: ABC transporter permease [Caldicoprobacterales bacterium]